MELEFGITKEKSSPNKYRYENKLFKSAELQMLTDAVLSSRFISKAKSKELIEKLSSLASSHEAEQLKRNIDCIHRPKSDNTESYHTINMVTDAIKNKVEISFKYTEYNERKKKVYRNNGNAYKVSPYRLYWNEDFYYLIGWDEKHKDVISFRVDRMEGVRQTKGAYTPEPEGLDMDDYDDQYFKMFGGEKAEVTLEVRNDLMKYIIDRFGIGIETEIYTEETFIARPKVRLSPTFYGWIFQFGGGMKIRGPQEAVDEYEEMMRC